MVACVLVVFLVVSPSGGFLGVSVGVAVVVLQILRALWGTCVALCLTVGVVIQYCLLWGSRGSLVVQVCVFAACGDISVHGVARLALIVW